MKFSLRPLPLFFLFYMTAYMADPIFGTFLPVYLSGRGFDTASIGILLALGPVVSLVAQPFWGTLSDRAERKNLVLALVATGSALTMLLYPLFRPYAAILLVTLVFNFFRSSQHPLEDALSLDYLKHDGRAFGRIRLGGTLGYALMAVVAGRIAASHISLLFPLYTVLSLVCVSLVLRLPMIHGHPPRVSDSHSSSGGFAHLKPVVGMVIFVSCIHIALSGFGSYFPLYYVQEAGGNAVLMGWILSFSALSEVPFLLNADKIMARTGHRGLLILAGALLSLRFLLSWVIRDPIWLIPVQFLQGPGYILMHYATVTAISQSMPGSHKTRGQAFYAWMTGGVARIISALGGGFLIRQTGMRSMLLAVTLISATALLLFCLMTFRRRTGNAAGER